MVAGHLRERNGIYHMVLSYTDETGKRVTPYKSTGLPVKGNKRRAEAMLDKWRLDTEIDLEKRIQEYARNHSSLPQDIQFTKFMLDWLAMMKNNVEITTHASYSLVIKNQIVPYFDEHYPHLKLRDLNPLQIQEYYSWEMNEQGVALVSGFSPRIFSQVITGDTDPCTYMLNVLMSERYAPITA